MSLPRSVASAFVDRDRVGPDGPAGGDNGLLRRVGKNLSKKRAVSAGVPSCRLTNPVY
ncbi:MAG: hypothetical protein AB7P23_10195 [Amphiplicatus sp.]